MLAHLVSGLSGNTWMVLNTGGGYRSQQGPCGDFAVPNADQRKKRWIQSYPTLCDLAICPHLVSKTRQAI